MQSDLERWDPAYDEVSFSSQYHLRGISDAEEIAVLHNIHGSLSKIRDGMHEDALSGLLEGHVFLSPSRIPDVISPDSKAVALFAQEDRMLQPIRSASIVPQAPVTTTAAAQFLSRQYESISRKDIMLEEADSRINMILIFSHANRSMQSKERLVEHRRLQERLSSLEEVEVHNRLMATEGLIEVEQTARYNLQQLQYEMAQTLQSDISRIILSVESGNRMSSAAGLFQVEERSRHQLQIEHDRCIARVFGEHLSALSALHNKTSIAHARAQGAHGAALFPSSAPQGVFHEDEVDRKRWGSEYDPYDPTSLAARTRKTPPRRLSQPPTTISEVAPQGPIPGSAAYIAGLLNRRVQQQHQNQQQQQQLQSQQQQQQSTPTQKTRKGASDGAQSGDGSSYSPSPLSKKALSAGRKTRPMAKKEPGNDTSSVSNSVRSSKQAAVAELMSRPGLGKKERLQRKGRSPRRDGKSNDSAKLNDGKKSHNENANEGEVVIISDEEDKPAQQTLLERPRHDSKFKASSAPSRPAQPRDPHAILEEADEDDSAAPIVATEIAASQQPDEGEEEALLQATLSREQLARLSQFEPNWGWMLKSTGVLMSWQRRFFVFTRKGKLKYTAQDPTRVERVRWIHVLNAEDITRVEVDLFQDSQVRPPTDQYHSNCFYVDAVRSHKAPGSRASSRTSRFKFCCFNRAELNKWMWTLRSATDIVFTLEESGLVQRSPIREHFRRMYTILSPLLSTGMSSDPERLEIPTYRRRVQMEDDIAALEAQQRDDELKEREREEEERRLHLLTPRSPRNRSQSPTRATIE